MVKRCVYCSSYTKCHRSVRYMNSARYAIPWWTEKSAAFPQRKNVGIICFHLVPYILRYFQINFSNKCEGNNAYVANQ